MFTEALKGLRVVVGPRAIPFVLTGYRLVIGGADGQYLFETETGTWVSGSIISFP
jgi:hypothetical protein